jgi:hypothetical protein
VIDYLRERLKRISYRRRPFLRQLLGVRLPQVSGEDRGVFRDRQVETGGKRRISYEFVWNEARGAGTKSDPRAYAHREPKNGLYASLDGSDGAAQPDTKFAAGARNKESISPPLRCRFCARRSTGYPLIPMQRRVL